MQNLTIDTGMQEYLINNRAVLRFNPSDPNLYHRFFAAAPKLDALDAELTEQLKALPAKPDDARAERGLALLTDYDHRIKALLTEIFGGENDFDKVLEGVNLAGTGANGKRVVQNLLDALTPILQDGAAQHLQTAAANARAEADAARAAREQACPRTCGRCPRPYTLLTRIGGCIPTSGMCWRSCAGWTVLPTLR